MKKRHVLLNDKSGQFYLIAAMVIAGLVVGFIGVSNISQRTESTKVFELKEELTIESQKILEFAINAERTSVLQNFAKQYQDFVGENVQIYYVTGNEDNINVYYFKNGKREISYDRDENNILNFTIPDDGEYKLKIHKGLNFEFIITEDLKDERYVSKSF